MVTEGEFEDKYGNQVTLGTEQYQYSFLLK